MNNPSTIRPPAVAGSFYPAEPAALRQQLMNLLGEAPANDLPGLKVLLVPHAGYVYSGGVAARLYVSLLGCAAKIKRVILLGPAHRVALTGMAVPAALAWATPLGQSTIDQAARAQVVQAGLAVIDDQPHVAEHSLEVQLPFIQTLLPEASILPVAVGNCPPEQVAALIDLLWGGAETLIVLSSDLSHYLPYADARAIDQATVARLLAASGGLQGKQACGARPLNGFLQVASRRKLEPRLIDLRNSGDSAGDKTRVVGYASIAYSEPVAMLGEVLLRIARGIISANFGAPLPVVPALPALRQMAATFVTLTSGGRLRGCIGSLQAHRSLLDDIIHNARAAAFSDPRFPPLTGAELAAIKVEVSLLSPAEAIEFTDQASALAALRPGMDGVILTDGAHRATYLPQVWDQLPGPQQFLDGLKKKAGLAPDHWSDTLSLQRYAVVKWKEAA
jgi:AmmeMemoRadiSam system protein B/AmmeMemoRadiSam system protein A